MFLILMGMVKHEGEMADGVNVFGCPQLSQHINATAVRHFISVSCFVSCWSVAHCHNEVVPSFLSLSVKHRARILIEYFLSGTLYKEGVLKTLSVPVYEEIDATCNK